MALSLHTLVTIYLELFFIALDSILAPYVYPTHLSLHTALALFLLATLRSNSPILVGRLGYFGLVDGRRWKYD